MIDQQKKGFTLLEVMIAMLILSVSFSAIIYAVNNNGRDLRYLKQKTAAIWVAANVLTETQLGLTAQSFGSQQQLDSLWYWRSKVTSTENAGVERVKVTVSEDQSGQPVVVLEGFVKRAT